jgi:hypothetical protein
LVIASSSFIALARANILQTYDLSTYFQLVVPEPVYTEISTQPDEVSQTLDDLVRSGAAAIQQLDQATKQKVETIA